MLVAAALPGIPEVGSGDDLAELLADAAGSLAVGDVLVIAHKVVSKAEGRVVALEGVQAGERARTLGAAHGRDPRLVEVILGESAAIVRSRPGVLICRTHHGYVCANAGVDASNASAAGELVLLPADPDASARALRARLRELTGVAPAIVIADSFGRAWRIGQCDVAIGIAGLAPAEDWRGRHDAAGRMLAATIVAVADEAAAAADLVRGKDSREPAVLVRGLERHVTDADGPGAVALIRRRDEDLFL
ncbi:MAG: coenzyme F420-0:L-glutamate ligase / coenzyme F420:gamma-L-glutamate ligase [Frankiaceae bacterium]|jgi:coenzyme F420-0:L-glutamate ligase/coenzyme F420-1:gamma-L-glutamate ligase|nr:coenzyme F420-0:L-glutamate ligase / coenzyme F420:gamma-L-glutamate ligase [Frankiaceae bacterium]